MLSAQVVPAAAVETVEPRAAAATGAEVAVRDAPLQQPPQPALSVRQRSATLVGLYNSGSTCYLNSLLQALYMTPEFRRLLFAWRAPAPVAATGAAGGAGGASAASLQRSVPFQLQMLFARLSSPTRARAAVDTLALTHSFGWSHADTFRQHDVQELMRVLFGALEPACPTLAALYTGTLLDTIQCCSCGARRERADIFQDLSLSVSNCSSLAASLRAFIAPERLEGDNALRCSSAQCAGTKQPALKSLSLRAPLPKILTFQLKRFIFNFQLMQRVKLNDAFEFPERIDMDEFVQPVPTPAAETVDEPAAAAVSAPGGAAVPDHSAAAPTASTSTIYELFAILLHSGVALGGHYFAYLRSPADGRFWEFNDAQVWAMDGGTDAALQAARGGGGGAGENKGGASAYMLMYRRVDKEAKDKDAGLATGTEQTESLVSDEVRELIAAEERQYEAEQAQAELERRMLHLTVTHALAPSSSSAAAAADAAISATASPSSVSLHLDCDTDMSHLLQQLLVSFGLSGTTALEDARLRKYDVSLRWASTAYAPQGTLAEAGLPKQASLLLETKPAGSVWPAVVVDAIPLRCVFVTPANVVSLVEHSLHPIVDSPEVFLLMASKSAGLGALRSAIGAAAAAAKDRPLPAIPSEAHMRLLLLHENQAQVLKDDGSTGRNEGTLHGFDLYPGRMLYVEHALEEEMLRPAFERIRCQIELCFNEPSDISSSVGAPVQPSYTRTIRVSRNDSLASAKRLIGQALGLDPSCFRVARSHTAPQLKDEDASLVSLQLVDQSALFVSMGRPLQKDEVQVRFFLLQDGIDEEQEAASDATSTTTSSDAEKDHSAAAASSSASTAAASSSSASVAPVGPSSRFLHLFDLPLKTSLTVRELKGALMPFLAARRPPSAAAAASDPLPMNGWGIRFLRVRDKKGSSSLRVLEDARTLAENFSSPSAGQLEDGIELCIQRLDAPEVWGKNLLLIQIQQWHPRTQKLGPVNEVVIRHNITVGAMKAQLQHMLFPEATTASVPASSAVAAESSSVTAASAAAPAAPSPSLPPISLAKGKIVGRMKRADVAKLVWIGAASKSGNSGGEEDLAAEDSKLLRNALTLRSGELILFQRGDTPEEKAAALAAKDRKLAAAAAAAVAVAAPVDSSAAGAAPPASASSSTAAAPPAALKPWQRSSTVRSAAARKSAAGSSSTVVRRPTAAPVEHALRIGLTPEEEAACLAAEAVADAATAAAADAARAASGSAADEDKTQ